ncbi:GspE/PulE family protein [Vibrio sp. WJH972]
MNQSNLLEVLKKSKFLNTSQIDNICDLCSQRQITLPQAIASQAEINTYSLAEHCAAMFQLALHPVDVQSSTELIYDLDLEELVIRHHAIPVVLQHNWLTLAVVDPCDHESILAFQFATGFHIQRQLCDIAQAIELIDSLDSSRLSEPKTPLYQHTPPDPMISLPDIESTEHNEEQSHSTPIGQYIHQIILHGVQQGASDIHFEPFEQHYRVRMRIDGLLTTTHSPDSHLNRRLASRLKLLAQINIAEKRLPQDGRIKFSLDQQHKLDLRVSTIPTLWGEKVVLRILGSSHSHTPLDRLGLSSDQLESLHNQLRAPQGLILVTGPTGSGKTTTLYAALQYLNQERRNVSTVEDPIEIQLSGVNQIQINEPIGLDFSTVLRALLRQDPDIIMVGEIRDIETAKMAVRAAQTGHLVLSTLHTNSAYETLTRLNQMGIEKYQLDASLKMVIAQRLVRKLCPHCKFEQIETITSHTYGLSRHYLANSIGCRHCLSGYRGRVGLYDFYQPQPKTNALSHPGPRHCELWQQGLLLVKQGLTSLEELSRVVDPDSSATQNTQWKDNHEPNINSNL